MRLPQLVFCSLAAAMMASCSQASYAPSASTQPANPAASVADARPDHELGCDLSRQPLPGRYLILNGDGNFAGRLYTGAGVWEYGEVSAATEPTPTTDPSPPPTDVYVYVGHYFFAPINQVGCAYLVTSKNGKPLAGASNTLFDGAPPFDHDSFAMKATSGGKFRAQALISEAGGSGTIALSTGASGVLSFGKRQSEADIIAAMKPHFTFGCDPKTYVYKTVQAASPGTARGFGFTPNLPSAEYRPRFGYCGVENSYLEPSEVTSTQTMTFSHGALDYRLSANFSSSVDWANHPDVVVWEEAYRADGSRDNRSDVFLALVHVH